MRVQLLRDYDWPNLLRQTPGGRGVWEDVEFTLAPADQADYVVALNSPATPTTVRCAPQRIWAIMQEPPNEQFAPMHLGMPQFARVYTPRADLPAGRYVPAQPALPWHVDRDYDSLSQCAPPEKPRKLSWITSRLATWEGHRQRLRFLKRIRHQVPLDLYGRGFRPIPDKWDALAPYRYSLAVENFQNGLYWTEKLADCFLAWTMPIYYGATRIAEFFPPESMVCIDIADPDAAERIREVAESDLWLRRRDAIARARELVLRKHQLFPFLTEEIRRHQASRAAETPDAPVRVPVLKRPPFRRWPMLKFRLFRR